MIERQMLCKRLRELGKTGLKFVARLSKCLNFNKPSTVEPRFNEPLYNEVLGITNNIFQPSETNNSVTYGKEP